MYRWQSVILDTQLCILVQFDITYTIWMRCVCVCMCTLGGQKTRILL